MSSIKEYNDKIKSLTNTRKMTKAMKMVSASKLHKAHKAQANAKMYAQRITGLILRVSASVDSHLHPLLDVKDNPSKALILVFTSDKGLCGAFNHNANKQVQTWLKDNRANYDTIDISCCGKRGFMFFKNIEPIKKYYEDITGRPDFQTAEAIGEELMNHFMNGDYDEVYLSYNQFFSPLSQKAIFEKILPIDPQALHEDGIPEVREYLFEPSKPELLNFLVPHFLFFKIYFALLENAAGEHGARMSTMDSASKNASELIDKNTLLRNRARQAAITTELTEIVAGAEALN